MEVIAYCRVSTAQQEDDGLSLEAQADRIRRWAQSKEWPLQDQHIYCEAKSGKSAENRPKFQQAIERAASLKAAFVVCKLDRFARSTLDALNHAEKLHIAGANLVILDSPIDTTSPYGELMFTMLAAFGKLERRLIASRTRDALDHKRRKGEALGNVPFGWRAVPTGKARENRDGTTTMIKRPEPEPREQEVLAAMVHTQGSFGAKARALNAAGLYSRKNTPWSAGQIRRILMQQKGAVNGKADDKAA